MKKLVSLAFFMILVLLFPAYSETTALPAGTLVFAEWSENSWYHGTVSGVCDAGYLVVYDDGDEKCCSREEIVVDLVPAAGDLEPGIVVLAQWEGNDQFYPGTLGSETDGRYKIAYNDGDTGTCTLEQIRIRQFNPSPEALALQQNGRQAPTAEPVLDRALEIWRGGSSWAEITESGQIYIDGSHEGEIDADGDIYVEGSNLGEIDYEGDLYISGSHEGEIEMNGYFWKGGSTVGSITADGGIWLGGSLWGEAEPGNIDYGDMKVIAAVLAFFAEDFGFME